MSRLELTTDKTGVPLELATDKTGVSSHSDSVVGFVLLGSPPGLGGVLLALLAWDSAEVVRVDLDSGGRLAAVSQRG